jgi:hypothetical protein
MIGIATAHMHESSYLAVARDHAIVGGVVVGKRHKALCAARLALCDSVIFSHKRTKMSLVPSRRRPPRTKCPPNCNWKQRTCTMSF